MGTAFATITPLNGTTTSRAIRKVGFIGGGDVLEKKFFPALQNGAYPLERIVVCSLEAQCRLRGLSYFYQRVLSGSLLPLDALEAHGLLGADTLWIVATPPDSHITYAEQLSQTDCRIAIEKPIAATRHEAKLLLTLARAGCQIYPINHKLFNVSALACVDLCRRQPTALNRVTRIEANFYETSGFAPGRQIEDTIADIQYHLFTILVALLGGAGNGLDIALDRVQVATHQADVLARFQTPHVWTASRIRGHIRAHQRAIAFDFRQAKAAPRNDKFIRLLDAAGRPIHEIDLNESGHHAHARVLDALLQPTVNLRHNLADALLVMDLIDASRMRAKDKGAYAVGAWPEFL